MPSPTPETTAALARQLGVKPQELIYIGYQKAPGCDLFLYNVDSPGKGFHRSTVSIRVAEGA